MWLKRQGAQRGTLRRYALIVLADQPTAISIHNLTYSGIWAFQSLRRGTDSAGLVATCAVGISASRVAAHGSHLNPRGHLKFRSWLVSFCNAEGLAEGKSVAVGKNTTLEERVKSLRPFDRTGGTVFFP